MKVVPKLKRLNKNFITQYLKACGVIDVKRYLKPDIGCYDDPMCYPNMSRAIDSLRNYWASHAEAMKVGIVVDSDADGACSSALVYLFLKEFGVTPQVFFHMGKQHGIYDVLDSILDSGIEFLFVPDAGSNDIEECKALYEKGVQVVVLDHHEITADNRYAIVVNHHLADNLNTNLSGTGVTYKFVQAYYSTYCNMDMEHKYQDLVAISLVSDVCDLSSLENRAFINDGLNNLTNPFVKLLFEKVCKKRGYTPEAIAWDIAPLANALARSDEQETKLIFFNGLVGNVDYEFALKEMRRVKRVQDNSVKEVVSEIEPSLNMEHKAIVGFGSVEDKSYLGLIANKFTGKYNKPTILLRELDPTRWTGSLRSPIELATRINESGIAQAMGHECACGVTVNKSNLNRFIDWLDTLDLDDRPAIPVTAQITPDILTTDFMKSIADSNVLWGKGVDAPTFYLKLHLTRNDVFIYKKNITTLKLQVGNLAILKFFASDADCEKFDCDEFDVELVIGKCDINEYLGEITPQCEIVSYEVHPVVKETVIEETADTSSSWEALFE